MSKSRRRRLKQPNLSTASGGPQAKPLTPVKVPPLDDPSWKKFAERHERLMARHPNFEAHAEEQVRIFSQPPETDGSEE